MARETLSASHMEEQLVKDVQRRSLKVEIVTSADTETQVAGYWDEATAETDTTSTTTSVAQHEIASYWDWTTTDAKDVLATDSIVDNLVCQAAPTDY